MSDSSESNHERTSIPPHDQAEADSRRRAECAERISRLLSALDGGTSPGKTEYLTKKVIRRVKPNSDSDTATRFLLIDRNGPIGEFGSWEDACQYRNDLHHHSASIINADQKPLEPREVHEEPTDKPTNLAATQPATQPVQPAAEPAKLAAGPAQPAQLAAQPTQADNTANLSNNPAAAQPAKPEPAQSAKPEPAQSAKPEPAQPVKQEPAQPVKQEPAQPAKPEATQPTKLEAAPPTTQPAAIAVTSDSPVRSDIQKLKKVEVPCDSRPNSIPQTNPSPANSTVMRIVGKIFPAAAKTATHNACPEILPHQYELLILGNSDGQNTNMAGVGNLTLTCAPPAPNYGTIHIHYTTGLRNAPQQA